MWFHWKSVGTLNKLRSELKFESSQNTELHRCINWWGGEQFEMNNLTTKVIKLTNKKKLNKESLHRASFSLWTMVVIKTESLRQLSWRLLWSQCTSELMIILFYSPGIASIKKAESVSASLIPLTDMIYKHPIKAFTSAGAWRTGSDAFYLWSLSPKMDSVVNVKVAFSSN